MGDKIAVQTKDVRALEASSSVADGTYPESSIIPVFVTFSVEVSIAKLCDVQQISDTFFRVAAVSLFVWL